MRVAAEIVTWLRPVTERLIICGSLRRRLTQIGDVDVLFIPKMGEKPAADFFSGPEPVDLAAMHINELVGNHDLIRRQGSDGRETWGKSKKHAVHVASRIPVDLISVTAAEWFNRLVYLTGSAQSNTRIATAAQKKDWTWNPFGPGFTRGGLAGPLDVTTEREAFEHVGLPYLEPWERA
jgi:DNA polymerase/3'-5' exonuclease PolX